MMTILRIGVDMMTATIEWLIEEIDEHDDIVNVNHAETYAQAVQFANGVSKVRIGLVRDLPRLGGRSWAYIVDGKLPEYFTDAYDDNTARVPLKYHNAVRM
jgi:hypothetical protein